MAPTFSANRLSLRHFGLEERTGELNAALPQLPVSMRWEQVVDTWEEEQSAHWVENNCFTIGPRSVKVFVAK